MRGKYELDRVLYGSLELGPVLSKRFLFVSCATHCKDLSGPTVV
ncbi:hypothetical protein FOXG_19780 [Fusarium oxysporum f. sp. lycopersici 4287]|uniref:Uncharacterized protein n=2 Tax=Fusarium oxysporum TaxID=5507 RepID=A0A0J9V6P3_FUSO4|nr:hypothetical protein FOXG_19780 [Fusarium oxysporum f. sp. lycopersici 4287]EXK31685.1 hypothetical protein FOMG_12172 [Fusarium oxysporum f. sp. melonis 26406]KNB06833.1 hypothetical protein FOXG_19780 [Fusarium oxysporum f. sp. lycopersici 4287]